MYRIKKDVTKETLLNYGFNLIKYKGLFDVYSRSCSFLNDMFIYIDFDTKYLVIGNEEKNNDPTKEEEKYFEDLIKGKLTEKI